MTAPQYLAFDLGASSGRAILGTLHGDRMTLDELHRFTTPLVDRDGRLFWDLDALWDEVRRGLDEALRVAPELRSISVDSWAVDYVPIGHDASAADRPLRDARAYRDPRTRGRLEQALAVVPADELYRRTGIQLLEINTLYQLLADLEEEPELLRETTYRLPIADYLLYRLSGRAAVERTMASTTQLMDVHTGAWAMDLIRRFGLPDTGWPEIVPPGTVLGPLVTSGRALHTPPGRAHHAGGRRASSSSPRLRAADGPAVIAGCSHDTAAAVAAVPASRAGAPWAFLSSGTWSLLGVERAVPILNDAAMRANFTNEAGLDGTVRFLKNLTGLWVLQECERAWLAEGDGDGHHDASALIAEAAAAAAPAAVLDLNDARFAERSDMPSTLRAACNEIGIAAPNTRAELVRLVLESLAAGYARALGELEKVVEARIEVLHVLGGGSMNRFLCQLTAEACGRRVVAGPAEAAALGNLLVQARTLGDLPPGLSIRDVARASSDLHEYYPARTRAGAEVRITLSSSA